MWAISVFSVSTKKVRSFTKFSCGSALDDASLGKVLGPSFFAHEIPDVLERILNIYVDQRIEGETFLDTHRRIGTAPFKEYIYAKAA